MDARQGTIVSLSASTSHTFSKQIVPVAKLVSGIGMDGDAHAGATVQHRSRVAADPAQPNLRQVHLIGQELLDELRACGFDIAAGDLGENVTTLGLDLLDLPRGTRLHLGEEAVLEVTGLRNPCAQIEAFARGLLAKVVERDQAGQIVRKAGIMAIVVKSGTVRTGEPISVRLPPPPHVRLERV